MLRANSGEKQLALFLDDDYVTLLGANREFISLGKGKRKHPKVFDDRLTIDSNFEIADELIEREIDLMLFRGADYETELHVALRLTNQCMIQPVAQKVLAEIGHLKTLSGWEGWFTPVLSFP